MCVCVCVCVCDLVQNNLQGLICYKKTTNQLYGFKELMMIFLWK